MHFPCLLDLLDAILIFSNCSMMTGCHQLDSLLARSYLQESLKKKTLYAISGSNRFSAGLCKSCPSCDFLASQICLLTLFMVF